MQVNLRKGLYLSIVKCHLSINQECIEKNILEISVPVSCFQLNKITFSVMNVSHRRFSTTPSNRPFMTCMNTSLLLPSYFHIVTLIAIIIVSLILQFMFVPLTTTNLFVFDANSFSNSGHLLIIISAFGSNFNDWLFFQLFVFLHNCIIFCFLVDSFHRKFFLAFVFLELYTKKLTYEIRIISFVTTLCSLILSYHFYKNNNLLDLDLLLHNPFVLKCIATVCKWDGQFVISNNRGRL